MAGLGYSPPNTPTEDLDFAPSSNLGQSQGAVTSIQKENRPPEFERQRERERDTSKGRDRPDRSRSRTRTHEQSQERAHYSSLSSASALYRNSTNLHHHMNGSSHHHHYTPHVQYDSRPNDMQQYDTRFGGGAARHAAYHPRQHSHGYPGTAPQQSVYGAAPTAYDMDYYGSSGAGGPLNLGGGGGDDYGYLRRFPHTQHPKYKTVMCTHWMTSEGCSRGVNCAFAHGDKELRRPGNGSAGGPSGAGGGLNRHTGNGLYRTQICRSWRNGDCAFGANCRFAHGEEQLRGLHSQHHGAGAMTSNGVSSSSSSVGAPVSVAANAKSNSALQAENDFLRRQVEELKKQLQNCTCENRATDR